MDIARYFIENKTSSWLFSVILLIGGILAYQQLGRLEDPQFAIKQAAIITPYPGASPEQVEEEVTYTLENAIQQLPYVYKVTSVSSAGRSQIIVEMKSTYRANELRQIWDEMRRKINDITGSLPPGVGKPIINDDFGDVYGILLAVSGEGYNYEEIKSYVDYIRRELVLVDGVGKVTVSGALQEQVIVEISRAKLTALGIPPSRIYGLLQTQNSVSNAGRVTVGSQSIRLSPSGEFKSVRELEDLIISNAGAKDLIRLGDVATVSRDYQEIPNHIMRYQGHRALTIGISFAKGVNVVDVGTAIERKLAEFESARPYGMDLATVYSQPTEVAKSVDSFVLNLLEAVVIVIVVLLLFMGMRSGLLIGLILLLTIMGTFIFMKQMNIELQRISLGALIIALGMLVDNAIVVTEGILIGMQRGLSKLAAAQLIVKQTKWPLLGATVIAVVAFAPIGLSADATGEFANSLFWVLLVSLLLSWVTAITLTPFFADLMFKTNDGAVAHEGNDVDPYQAGIYQGYKRFLQACMHHRALTMASMAVLLVLSVVGFKQVKQAFFPPSTMPMFMVDVWHPEGTDIRHVEQTLAAMEKRVATLTGVEQVTTTIGRGADRFMLTYQTEKSYPAFAQLMVRMDSQDSLAQALPQIREMREDYPDLEFKIRRVEIGPSTSAKIEARLSGPDPVILRTLAEQVKAIIQADSGARNVRHDWREQTKKIVPVFNEAAARRVGVSKQDLDDVLQTSFSGKTVGLYRDGTRMLPIVARPPSEERLTIDSLQDVQIFSPVFGRYIPITQIVSGFDTVWEDPLILRKDRKRTLTVLADHDILGTDTAAALLKRIKPQVEAITMPEGYHLEWGGEFEASNKAQKALFGSLPMGYLVMFVITVLLFSSMRTATVIWTTVPLAIVGVSLGLLVTGKPFGFMALLGFLSLSGMIIKNGIVLAEQIKIEEDTGKDEYAAIVDAAVSRVRPVAMAAITTILGMIPLFFDDFFASMSVVIMFGLGFATVLTLIVVPVLYSLVYRVKLDQMRD